MTWIVDLKIYTCIVNSLLKTSLIYLKSLLFFKKDRCNTKKNSPFPTYLSWFSNHHLYFIRVSHSLILQRTKPIPRLPKPTSWIIQIIRQNGLVFKNANSPLRWYHHTAFLIGIDFPKKSIPKDCFGCFPKTENVYDWAKGDIRNNILCKTHFIQIGNLLFSLIVPILPLNGVVKSL